MRRDGATSFGGAPKWRYCLRALFSKHILDGDLGVNSLGAFYLGRLKAYAQKQREEFFLLKWLGTSLRLNNSSGWEALKSVNLRVEAYRSMFVLERPDSLHFTHRSNRGTRLHYQSRYTSFLRFCKFCKKPYPP